MNYKKATDDLLEISKEHYSKIFKERNDYQHKNSVKGLLMGLLIFLLVSWIGTSIVIKIKDINTMKENQILFSSIIDGLSEKNSSLSKDLKEKENEISQLKDRIGFLSVMGAMYEEEKIEELEEEIAAGATSEEKKEEVKPVINWKEYVVIFTIGQLVPLPQGIDTNTFRCMDYRKITDITSWQYKLQTLSKTDTISGLRYYEHNGEKYYTVALATAYGIDIGNAYKVTLQNGTTFNIIHAEYKHDIRYPSPTDFGDADKNYDGENTISVIEFVYDWKSAPSGLISDGEANRWLGEGCDIYGDGCNIKSMEYLGKIWTVT